MDTLTERLRANDADALARLYDETARRAFGVAYRVLGDGQSAEDVVQEAFLELWRHRDRLDASRGRPGALLLTIVHRRAIDAVRRRSRRAEARSLPEQIDDRATDLLERAELVLDRDRIRGALESLTPVHGETVRLAYFEQRSQREIAERMGVPIGTVKSRLHAAIGQLREAFGIGEGHRHGVR